ncbi:MAG: DUF4252 domain-containing protein [Muribaculaceae bacterium]|nr:DUF4252 domain-containing protein [Muribaculaceae bacterium]
MKKIKMLFVALMCVVASSSCSAQRLFSEASNIDGVNSVLVTKPMLKIAGESLGTQDGVDMGKLINNLNCIEVITAPAKQKAKVLDIYKKVLAGAKTETLVEVKENGQNVEIIALSNDKNPELYKGLIIVSDESNELTLLYMAGDFTMDELMGAIGSASAMGSDE